MQWARQHETGRLRSPKTTPWKPIPRSTVSLITCRPARWRHGRSALGHLDVNSAVTLRRGGPPFPVPNLLRIPEDSAANRGFPTTIRQVSPSLHPTWLLLLSPALQPCNNESLSVSLPLIEIRRLSLFPCAIFHLHRFYIEDFLVFYDRDWGRRLQALRSRCAPPHAFLPISDRFGLGILNSFDIPH